MPQTPLSKVLVHLRLAWAAQQARELTDDELLQRYVADREDAAFAVLVERHGPMVLSVCRRVLGDAHTVDDVFQATFMVLVRRASSIRKNAPLGNWLHGVAQRIALRARAKQAAQRKLERRAGDMPRAETLDEVTWQELRAVLDEEIGRLPAKYQAPIVLCYLQGKSYDQAAKEIRLPKSSLASRLAKARELLRHQLTKRGLALSAGALATALGEKTAGAAVGARLALSTVKAAASMAVGKAVAGACISAQAIALTEEAIKGMVGIKGILVVALLAVVLGIGGVGLAGNGAWTDQAKATSVPKSRLPFASPAKDKQSKPPKKPVAVADADAPLPAGAVMRLGETRFRPGARITYLAFSPDGAQIASWGNWMYFEDRLSIWDVATGKELHTQSMAEDLIGGLCWGPGGRGFAALNANDNRPGKGSFRLWSFADPKDKLPPLPFSARGVKGYLMCQLSPDGAQLAVFRSGTQNKGSSIDLFEAKACESEKELTLLANRGGLLEYFSGMKFIRGGKAVVILTMEEKASQQLVVIWDIAKDVESDPVKVPVGVYQGRLRQSFDVTDDGSAVAVGLEDGTVKIFELPSGKERLSVKKHDGPKHGGKWSEVSAVKFVNGGRNVLSAGRDNQQIVWDAKTGAKVADLNGHDSWVEAVAISPDGKRVATAGQDSLIRLWDATTWQPILPPQGPRDGIWRVEVSRDGKYAAAGSSAIVHVWELATARELRSFPSDFRSGYALFSPEGNVLAGDRDGKLRLYPIPTGAPKQLAAKGMLLEFTPDGKTLLTAQDKTVCLWDWPACTQRSAVPMKGKPASAAISPDGKTAIIGFDSNFDGGAAIIDLASGKATSEMPFKLHWFSRAAGFGPTSRMVCGVTERGVEAWNILTRSQTGQFEGHQKASAYFSAYAFAVSADGRRSASCHSNGSVTVYETATGSILAHFDGHREHLVGIALTPDGNRVLSGGADHQILVWDVSLGRLAGKVEPLSTADRLKAWDQLGTQPAKEAFKTMAALALDQQAAVTLLAAKLKPAIAVDAAVLDRIFRGLDDATFAVRDKAERELNALGAGAIAGVREREAKAQSLELKQRAQKFLRQFDPDGMTPDRIRFTRALEILTAVKTPAARKLLENLAAGASGVWETESARRTLIWMNADRIENGGNIQRKIGHQQ